jgi:hypothetical protein
MPTRIFFIIARGERRLFAEVRQSFVEMTDVEVMFDRRLTERRRTPPPAEVFERRRISRRRSLHLDDHLRAVGWAIARPTVTVDG